MGKKVEVKWEHRQVMIEECESTIIVPENLTDKQVDIFIMSKLKKETEYGVMFERYEKFKGEELKEPEIKIIDIHKQEPEIKIPEPLKIYHVCRKEEAGFDEVQDFVIVASNVDEVFMIARRNKGDEALLEWSTYFSIIKEIGLYAGDEKESHVLCKNFKNN